jgi:hypothetical protein
MRFGCSPPKQVGHWMWSRRHVCNSFWSSARWPVLPDSRIDEKVDFAVLRQGVLAPL